MNDELPACIPFNSKGITMVTKNRLRNLTDKQLEALSDWSIAIRTERMVRESQQKQAQHYYTGGVNGLVKKAKRLVKKLGKEKDCGSNLRKK